MVVTDIREPGLTGKLGLPREATRPPAVLALGGSDGVLPEYFLRLLVPEGFACLALAYFGTPETQPALTEVPLERIARALRWLVDDPAVEAPRGRVALVGVSKGGELALLAAATFPELVGPVVAYTPSSVVWEGIDLGSPGPPRRSSWSVDGQPLPFVPFPTGTPPAMSERGVSFLPIYSAGLDDAAAVEKAAIPIERAAGPVLLVSGGDDRMWPAERMCRMIVDRAHRAGRAQLVGHLHYPQAGHVLFPYEPTTAAGPAVPFDLGGDFEAAEAAHADAWPHVLRHLRG